MDMTFWCAVFATVIACLAIMYALREAVERRDEVKNADAWRERYGAEKAANHNLRLENAALNRELYRLASNAEVGRMLSDAETVPVNCEERAG